MEQRKERVWIVVSVVLTLALCVALWGWMRARNDMYAILSDANKDLASFEDRLKVCENPQSEKDKTACSSALKELSDAITYYNNALGGAEIPDEAKQP